MGLLLESLACTQILESQIETKKMESNSKFYFHKSGNQFRVTPKVSLDLHEVLPVGTYSVNYDDCSSQYYLETINDFQLKGKIYGNVVRSSSRILNTFLDRPRSTGVLLVGEKGSGKTLLAQYTSIVAAKEKGIPTIVVNKPWHGDQFNSFIQSISQPVIVLMDEFEKVYTNTYGEENYQEKILTLFDGVYASQKLFLLTCNDKSRMDANMMNRPGRLYYLLEFNGLDQSFVEEYCNDNLVRKDYIPAVCAIAAIFQSFNFDMLKAIVEDMNRYGESPSEVLEYLNARPDIGGNETFTVKLIVDGKKKKKSQRNWSGSPISGIIRVYSENEEGDEEEGRKQHYFSSKNLLKLDPKTREFKFQNEAGEVLHLTPAPVRTFSLNYKNVLVPDVLNGAASEDATCDAVSATEEETYDAMMGDY